MKKANGFMKRRLIAIALSVITVTSFATMSFTTASAAKTTSTISTTLNKNKTSNLLNVSKKEEKQAIRNIKQIKQAIDDYKAKSAQEAKEAKAEKRKEKMQNYASKNLSALTNVVKGEYVSAVKDIVGLFPYGDLISGVIDLVSAVFDKTKESEVVVPAVTLEDIKEQLGYIENSINDLKKAVKENENSEFYKNMNEIVLVYKSAGAVIKIYIDNEAELTQANTELEKATKSGDAEKIEEATEKVITANENLESSKKQIKNFFGDDFTNYFYKLHESLTKCTQFMNSLNLSLTDSKENSNPFFINFKAKIDGAKTGASLDSIIEETMEENEKIWKYYELGLTMYSVIGSAYVSYLNEKGETDKAESNAQTFASFMTGIYPGTGTKVVYNEINAIDVHDFYMSTIIPKMLEYSGKYKFKDGSISEKAAEVTCNGTIELFTDFEDAWNYATQYTNTTIKLCKDVKIKKSLYIGNKIKNNIELDLQGHTIDSNSDYNIISQSYYTLNSPRCTLKIISSNGKACIKNSKYTAIDFSYGDLTIENCIFENNKSGAVSTGTYVKTNINNCIFKNNSGYFGGAVSVRYNYKISDCIFENNKAKYSGGAIYAIGDSDSVIENCTFNNNISDAKGGAIKIGDSDMDSYASGRIKNCTFNENYAKEDGGSIYVVEHTDIELDNVTIRNNKADGNGGGIYLGQLSSTNHYFRNVTIENNVCGKEGGGVYANASGFNTADIKLFGWNIIRNNTKTNGSASNAMMIKSAARTVFKITDEFDPYSTDISGTTDSNGSCMVFLNSSSKYTYCYNYTTQARAFRADHGSLKQSGSNIYWSK
ncbi:MAG: right-handed parallel beta-helix repeat-containing protein [Ruminococcus sp.]